MERVLWALLVLTKNLSTPSCSFRVITLGKLYIMDRVVIKNREAIE